MTGTELGREPRFASDIITALNLNMVAVLGFSISMEQKLGRLELELETLELCKGSRLVLGMLERLMVSRLFEETLAPGWHPQSQVVAL